MGTTASLQTRIERLRARLTAARNTQAINQKYADEGVEGSQQWADHFEGVAQDLEQKIYEMNLLLEKQ